ncbi:hypothetical protein TVAG_275970 [Trichomonas vaginalis G3]|uniref:Uncharacterized protein n=1 Tax=Trichomonas vaginalis (strain ATCC PRA-98 / G3) TaxID=412133 RepID=A2EYH0_TRIV3|nr:hypothetical protein TVAGG3_0864320 [Trichomonas vaginalis G3]EAY02323.1 hypothetical protein TVAG_275970 [Trichomonas vaginalis G3]KAI5500904.1 hypothetical protein TVAGG3_0864320 [Trichomonas vaginalis G3]|eukprot:XP_001314638.1 hypothetical protein [Trichomonas vaginalis G3]
MISETEGNDDITDFQLNCAMHYFEDMITNLKHISETIELSLEKVDTSIDNTESEELTRVCISVKQFILQLHNKIVDQIFCLDQGKIQLEGIIEENTKLRDNYLKGVASVDAQTISSIESSVEALEKVSNLITKMNSLAKSESTPAKVTKELKPLFKQYTEAKNNLNNIKSQCVINQEISDRHHIKYQEEFKKKQQDIIDKFSFVISCAAETVCSSFSSMSLLETQTKLTKPELKVKFRDFEVPTFTPYVFKNKHHTLDPIESPVMNSAIVPYGVAEINKSFESSNRTFSPGEKVLLMDNTDRPYAAIEFENKIYCVPRNSLTIIKFGPPSKPGPITVDNY